ncbi:hypothetical protein UlMin_036825 [Ulmus minor]
MKLIPFSFPFLPIFLTFLFFFFNFFHVSSCNNLIHETCKKFSETDPNLSYKFCIASLESEPGSHCADLRKLGLISINLTKRNVSSTSHFIEVLLKNKKLDPYTRARLSDCMELYTGAIDTTKEAKKHYRSKHYKEANVAFSSVMDTSTTCEDGFKEKRHVVSPLTKRNNDTFQLSAIALSIITMFLGN